jgi:hypothetical protein
MLEDDIVSSVAHEGLIRFIVQNDWINHYYKILSMILVTKGIPVTVVMSFMLNPTKPRIILNIISNLVCLGYEMFQFCVRKEDYFKNAFNYLDLASFASGLIWHCIAVDRL